MKANGSGLEVFTPGIHQPWRMAFTKGSNDPFVSALGQDNARTHRGNWCLRVEAGSDKRFPKIHSTTKQACVGYAKPFNH